jgi:hypothetical protein
MPVVVTAAAGAADLAVLALLPRFEVVDSKICI